MAPERRHLSCQESLERINVLVNLGLPIDNIKVHPHIINCCQPLYYILILEVATTLQSLQYHYNLQSSYNEVEATYYVESSKK